MDDDELVFKALADPTRRSLLDRLFENDGLTLGELEAAAAHLTRFGVMKHLAVLEQAGLVVTRKKGRFKHHFLNPVPIALVYERWVAKYRERRVAAAQPERPTGGNSHANGNRFCNPGVPALHSGNSRAGLGRHHKA